MLSLCPAIGFAVPTAYVDSSFTGSPGTAIVDADATTAGNQGATIGTDAFATIQAGVAAVDAGGTVIVAAGSYDEAVALTKRVTLRGPNAGLSAQGAAARAARGSEAVITKAVLFQASGSTVDGISFTGANVVNGEIAHLQVFAPNITIKNVISNSKLDSPYQVSGQSALGVVLGFGADTSGLSITDSYFVRQRTGVFANPPASSAAGGTWTYARNEFSSRTGVNMDFGWPAAQITYSGNTIGYSAVDSGTYGPVTALNFAQLVSGSSVLLNGNTFESNFVGPDFKQIEAGASVTVTNNDFRDLTGVPAAGMFVTAATGALVTIHTNTFHNATYMVNRSTLGLDLTVGGTKSNSFETATGTVDLASASFAQLYTIADRILDGVDFGSGIGAVRLKSGTIVVTPNSFFASAPFSTTTASIQRAISLAGTGETVRVASGAYTEDVAIDRAIALVGDDPGSTSLIGKKGGSSATIAITSSNTEVAGFTITREGNSVAEWNDSTLNSAGIAIQGTTIANSLIHDNVFFGNRSGIDINNSSTHTIRNNVITSNRTGIIFRNQTDNLVVTENDISANFTVGILFLDGSGGTNSPVQSALNSTFTNNRIADNWYGQIVDRQSGGSIPAPGTTNRKNFAGNWLGAVSPIVTTNNSAEPGYAAQIPTLFGGSAVAPARQPEIAGSASANIDYLPLVLLSTDTDVETTPGRGTFGFQGTPILPLLRLYTGNSTKSAIYDVLAGQSGATLVSLISLTNGFGVISNGKVSFKFTNPLIAGGFTFSATDAQGNLFTREVVILPPSQASGLYYGLLRTPTGKVRGRVSVSVGKGAYMTGTVRIGAKSFTFKSYLYTLSPVSAARAAFSVGPNAASGQPTLEFSVLDTNSSDILTGTAERSPYSTANPAPQLGRYTFIAQNPTPGTAPALGAMLSCKITATGAVTVEGKLGNNQSAANSGQLLSGGRHPMFVTYGSDPRLQSLAGEVNFDHLASQAVSGTVAWSVPASVDAHLPTGVAASYGLVGYRFVSPENAAGFFSPPSLTATITLPIPSIGPASPLSLPLSLTAIPHKGTQKVQSPPNCTVQFSTVSGQFSGKYTISRSSSRTFFGVMLQGPANRGVGTLLEPTTLQPVTIVP